MLTKYVLWPQWKIGLCVFICWWWVCLCVPASLPAHCEEVCSPSQPWGPQRRFRSPRCEPQQEVLTHSLGTKTLRDLLIITTLAQQPFTLLNQNTVVVKGLRLPVEGLWSHPPCPQSTCRHPWAICPNPYLLLKCHAYVFTVSCFG